MTPEAIAELKGYLRAADRAAQGDETIQKRIAFLSAGLEYTARQPKCTNAASRTRPGSRDTHETLGVHERAFLKQPLAVNVAVVAGMMTS